MPRTEERCPELPGLGQESPADLPRLLPGGGWLLEAVTGAGRLSAQKWPPQAGPPALASVSGQPLRCRCPVPRHPPRGSARLQRQEHAALTMT